MNTRQFLAVTGLTHPQLSYMVNTETWKDVLIFRGEYARALSLWAKNHKGNEGGIDNVQCDALCKLALLDKWLWKKYYKSMLPKFLSDNPNFLKLPPTKTKNELRKGFRELTARHF